MPVAKKSKKEVQVPVQHKFKLKKYLKVYSLPAILTLLLILVSLITFEVYYEDKFFPRTKVGDIDIGLLTKTQSFSKINSRFKERSSQKLKLNYNNSTFEIDLATSSAQIDTATALNVAFLSGHEEPSFKDKLISQIVALFLSPITYTPVANFEVEKQIGSIADNIYRPPENALISIYSGDVASNSAEIKISEGKNGLELDKDKLKNQINDYLVLGQAPNIIPTKVAEPDITNLEAQAAKTALENVQKKPLTLSFGDQSWTIDAKTLFNLLDLPQKSSTLIDKTKLSNYLADLSQKINQPVIEPLFSFDNNLKKVTAFKPAQEGRELDLDKTALLISDAIIKDTERNIPLPVKVLQPKIKATDADNFGIKELLAEGISNFSGSIPNRIFNVGLAASRINGILIAPGQDFSFTGTVGDITAGTGYKPAYVIKSGRTVLDDGGGVCQVSTTLYRAALKAGLPITNRTAHAYRVGYYEQGFPPGLDATIFYPSVDLKFKNDTASNILIQSYVVGTTLYVDLYGTPDGRVAYLSTPVITSQTPPPPELRQDDPTLPKGEVKQVDFAAWGANVTFTRTVKKAGETLISETIRSNYRPWQAVYLVGTKE